MEDSHGLSAGVDWADLPAELLAIIHVNLGDSPAETLRLRSVCRWWRFSTPPLPNKLSALFPMRPAALGDNRSPYDFVIYASAVYLVQSVRMVSVQEASPGTLLVRDPMWYTQIFPNSPVEDGVVADWICATQTPVARFYAYNRLCFRCGQATAMKKVVFVPDSRSHGVGLVGACSYSIGGRLAFKTDLNGRLTTTTMTTAVVDSQFYPVDSRYYPCFRGDIVAFNGHIIAINNHGHVYFVDHTSLDLVQVNSIAPPSSTSFIHLELYFVVSEGDLYVVLLDCYTSSSPLCQIYKLVISTDDTEDNSSKVSSLEVEQVEDLGDDRVFFVTMSCSFSVSARLLPPPWKGNCIVYRQIAPTMCQCIKRPAPMGVRPWHESEHSVFLFGGGQSPRFVRLASLEGYSDLVSPESLLLLQIKDLDLKAGSMD